MAARDCAHRRSCKPCRLRLGLRLLKEHFCLWHTVFIGNDGGRHYAMPSPLSVYNDFFVVFIVFYAALQADTPRMCARPKSFCSRCDKRGHPHEVLPNLLALKGLVRTLVGEYGMP